MTALRRISTRRLLAICAVTVAASIGVTAVAMATSGGGPKPPPKPLANAVHDALGAPAVPGISAGSSSPTTWSTPPASKAPTRCSRGATGRLWASPDGGGKLRLELQSEGRWRRQPGAGLRPSLPDLRRQLGNRLPGARCPKKKAEGRRLREHGVPGLGEIEAKIAEVEEHAELSGAIPSDVAGQPTYTLHVAPKHDGGLLGGAELAWDAANGIPLRAAIYSSASSSPVLAAGGDRRLLRSGPLVGLRHLAAAGAKVVDLTPSGEGRRHRRPDPGGRRRSRAAERRLPAGRAELARRAAAGRSPQHRSRRQDGRARHLRRGPRRHRRDRVGERTGRRSRAPAATKAASACRRSSINGAQGEELDTALGTVLRFSRGGVDYIVIGSVPPAAAEAAARAL